MDTRITDWQNAKELIAGLKEGGVIAFPTETVYGLACLASSQKGFDTLCEVKRRSADKPFALMCSSLGEAAKYCPIDAKTVGMMKKYLPGELTVLLKSRGNLPTHVDLGTGVNGVRVPASDAVLEFIEAVGEPLLVTSANISGEQVCQNFEETKEKFEGKILGIVQGECVSNVPTTIVDCSNGDIKLVRQGKLAFEDLEKTYRDSTFKIAIGSDHGGFAYKEKVKEHLLGLDFEVEDCGTYSTSSCDYPMHGKAVGESVAKGKADLGVVICTSGEGIAIAANKVKGVRCGIGYCDEVVVKMREHNDANVISFGQKYMDLDDVVRRTDMFIAGIPSPLEKHHRRVKQIED